MDIKSKYLLIKSHIFEKRNIIFIFINLFIYLSTLITFSLLYFSITYKYNSLNNDISYKTIETYKKDEYGEYIFYDDYSFLDNMDHIIFHVNAKYNGFYSTTTIHNKDYDLTIIPLIDKNEINKDINNNEIVCSNYLLTLDEEGKIESILNTKKILNETIKINDISLKLISTYNSHYNMTSSDTCYVSKDTYDKLTEYQEDDYSHIIRVDNIENVANIKSELVSNNLSSIVKYENGEFQLFILISIFIALIIIIITLTILYNYIKKKTLYRLKRYGILKTCGYKDKNIINVEVLENTIISLLSFIISFLIFIPLYKITTINILYEFLYESIITYDIPIIIPIISFLFGIILTIISTHNLLKKYFKNDISIMLEGE